MPNSKFASVGGKILIALSILFGIAGSVGFYNHSRFQSRVAQLRDEGQLVSFEDFKHQVANPEDDALTYLKQVIVSAKEMSEAIPRDELGGEKTDLESIALFQSLSAKHPELFKNISRSAQAADMTVQFDEDEQLGVMDFVKIGNVLSWKGQVLVAQGETAAAATVAWELLELAEKIDRPFVLNALLGNSFRARAVRVLGDVLASGEVDAAIVEKINFNLDGIDFNGKYVESLKAERSIMIYYMINPQAVTDQSIGRFEWVSGSLRGGAVALSGNSYLDEMELVIERCQAPPSTQYVKEELESELGWTLSSFSANPAAYCINLRKPIGRVTAQCRAIRIALALQSIHNADLDASFSVEDLVELGVPEEMALDPFTDQVMVVARVEGHWKVYSVGPDKNDDGGTLDSDDLGVMPRLADEIDSDELDD
ncbi:MAG: hypothetical protein ACI87E_005239 [Mariniblastus sp.]|jgi:hypothetical protein